jgi:hypothetical protein
MTIEALDFGKEPDVEGVLIQSANRIMGIDGRHEAITRIVDGFEMTGRHEAADAGHREILQ